jgi:hypothetical protein
MGRQEYRIIPARIAHGSPRLLWSYRSGNIGGNAKRFGYFREPLILGP